MAVVGHVEWVTFARVEKLPSRGEIIHASEWWDLPGGSGPAAAVQLFKLAGGSTFYTAVGDDELGHRTVQEIARFGVAVHAAFRPTPSRRAITHIDVGGERTITVLGDRLAPLSDDPLPWDALNGTDGVYSLRGM